VSGPLKITTIAVKQLNQSDFAPFGAVVSNPAPTLTPTAGLTPQQLPSTAILANQGSAIKYQDVTHMLDLYSSAPSKVASKAVMNMFICAPRSLRHSPEEGIVGNFPVEILERHPFTTQTFIPLGHSATEHDKRRYVVIVAPSLPPSNKDEELPVPSSSRTGSSTLPGRGLPDLSNIKAFIADGSQAVTYSAGTWHAPMVVVGRKPVDFVVVQHANGVGIEDCQEVVIDGGKLNAAVPLLGQEGRGGLWKL
jgi:ureidoglycolate lyase